VPIVNRDVASQDNTEASKELEKNFPWMATLEEDEDSVSRTSALAHAAEPDSSQAVVEQQRKAEIVAAEKEGEGLPSVGSVEEPEHPAAADMLDQHKSQQIVNEKKPQPAPPSPASVEKEITSSKAVKVADGSRASRKRLIIYGVIALIIGAALIVFAMALENYGPPGGTDAADDAAAKQALKFQREQDEKKFRQLQIEAETLKRERDAAIEKAEAERLANEQAEKKAAEAAALAAKAAAEKTRAEELKRVEAAKRREREAKQAEAKAREAAERARLEAARLEEQKRIMQIRLEEERQLKELQEARRLELERQEAERLQRLAAEEQARKLAADEAAAKAAEEAKKISAECSGPTARFKSTCR
jgi:hypothetical protein